MLGFHDEPDSLYGIEVGRIGRKMERLEEMPVELFPFVPGRVVEDKDIPLPGRSYGLSSLVEENLEHVGVAAACLDSEELSRAGTDSPQDVQTDMIAVMNRFRPGPLDRPTPSGLRLSFGPRLVAVPQFHVGILRESSQPIHELLSQLLILPVGPGPGHFQDIAFFVQKATDGLVRALHPIFLRDMAVESGRGPKCPLGASRLLELFEDFLLSTARNKRSPTRPFLCDEAVDAVQIEGSDDLSYFAVGQLDGLHDLFPRGADEEHDNHETPPVGFSVPGFPSRLEIGKRCVLGIGGDMSLGHDP